MKLRSIIWTLASFALLQACHNPDQKWDSKSSADTLNNMKDSVADSSKSMSRDLVMKVNKNDAKFAVEAANGGMAEVELGKLAVVKGQSEEVKNFGSMMVNDHSTANQKLIDLAKRKGISLPATISASEQKIKDELAKKSGKEFDKAYVDAMIRDHQEDVKTFETALQELKDQDLKDLASATLPTLKIHLSNIEKVKNAVR